MKGFDEEKFLKSYRGNEKFITEGKEYYNLFLSLLDEDDLLEKIRFANDYLGESPLKAFIYYCREENKTDLFNCELEKYVKQGLGSCFGFLYRFMYKEKYMPKQCLMNDSITGIVTVSRFVRIK